MSFPDFGEVLSAIDDLKEKELIEDYAISGAVAQLFWDEAIPTFDLDVLVLVPKTDSLDVLRPIYEWAAERGYPTDKEHIYIGGVPVQFIPTFSPLTEEAVREAKSLPYNDLSVNVVGPEHLVGIWMTPPANNAVRRERVARLRASGRLDEDVLADLVNRYGLKL